MTRGRRKIFYGIPKVFFLLLYIPFFLIQGFACYHQTLAQNNCDTQICSYENANAPGSTCIKAKGNKIPKKSNVRLNKRFQPSSVSLCEIASFGISFFRKGAALFYHYPDPFLSSVYLLTHTLRGPPEFA
jgi:hypothetical protein